VEQSNNVVSDDDVVSDNDIDDDNDVGDVDNVSRFGLDVAEQNQNNSGSEFSGQDSMI
jgi:hypothetical protein